MYDYGNVTLEALPVRQAPETVPSVATVDVHKLLNLWASELSPASRETYSACLQDFTRYTNSLDVADAVSRLLASGKSSAKAVLIQYKADLHEGRGLAPNTVNLRLAALKSLLAFAEGLDVITWSVRVKPLKATVLRDTRGPSTSAVSAMIDAAGDRGDAKGTRDVAIMRCFHDLGLRRNELRMIDLADVDLEAGTVSILGKGRTEKQRLTLPAATCRALATWLEARGDQPGAIFTSVSNHGKGQRMSGAAIYSVIRSLGRAAGVTTSPHRLRHRSITTACELEVDLGKVQRFSRHQSVEMIGRYRDNLEDAGGAIACKVAATV